MTGRAVPGLALGINFVALARHARVAVRRREALVRQLAALGALLLISVFAVLWGVTGGHGTVVQAGYYGVIGVLVAAWWPAVHGRGRSRQAVRRQRSHAVREGRRLAAHRRRQASRGAGRRHPANTALRRHRPPGLRARNRLYVLGSHAYLLLELVPDRTARPRAQVPEQLVQAGLQQPGAAMRTPLCLERVGEGGRMVVPMYVRAKGAPGRITERGRQRRRSAKGPGGHDELSDAEDFLNRLQQGVLTATERFLKDHHIDTSSFDKARQIITQTYNTNNVNGPSNIGAGGTINQPAGPQGSGPSGQPAGGMPPARP